MVAIAGTIIFTLIIYGRFYYNSLKGNFDLIKGFEKSEISSLLEKEEFVEIFKQGKQRVYESNKWINIDRIFIPKKFFKLVYVTQGSYEVYTINLILNSGYLLSYRMSANLEEVDKLFNKLMKGIESLKVTNERLAELYIN